MAPKKFHWLIPITMLVAACATSSESFNGDFTTPPIVSTTVPPGEGTGQTTPGVENQAVTSTSEAVGASRAHETPEGKAALATPATPEMNSGWTPLTESGLGAIGAFATLERHTAAVTDIAFSPDGSTLATSSEDGSIRLWRVLDGALLLTLEGHSDHVLSVDFSPDGSRLASGSNDGTVAIWDPRDGTLLQTIESYAMGRVLKVAYSPEGSFLAIANHLCYVQLRYSATGILFRTLVQPECAAKLGGTVQTWGFVFSPDGEQIITGEGRPCCGGSLQSWPIENAFTPPTLLKGYQLQTRDLAISSDGSQLALALLGSSVLWLLDTRSGALLHTFEGHSYRVNSVTFSPDGALLASGSRDQKVRLWRASDSELLQTLQGHESEINCVLFSPNGDVIASGSEDGEVILWGVPDGK